MSKGSPATNLNSIRRAKEELRRFLRDVDRKPYSILKQEARYLKNQAKKETPRDTGRLERSVNTSVSRTKRGPSLNISASARDVRTGFNYAALQHENIYFKHSKGKSHYLLDPYNRTIRRLRARFEKEIKPPGGK
jgi:hypothetical protein